MKKKNKIVIVIEGGIVQEIFSNNEIEAVIVDYDNSYHIDADRIKFDGLSTVSQDAIFEDGEAYELIKPLSSEFTKEESIVKEFLKEIGF